jgi:hypothetical protein
MSEHPRRRPDAVRNDSRASRTLQYVLWNVIPYADEMAICRQSRPFRGAVGCAILERPSRCVESNASSRACAGCGVSQPTGWLRRRADKRERPAIGCVDFAPVWPGIGCARQKSKRDDHIESDRQREINHADGNERPLWCPPVFAINRSNQHGPTSTYPAYT